MIKFIEYAVDRIHNNLDQEKMPIKKSLQNLPITARPETLGKDSLQQANVQKFETGARSVKEKLKLPSEIKMELPPKKVQPPQLEAQENPAFESKHIEAPQINKEKVIPEIELKKADGIEKRSVDNINVNELDRLENNNLIRDSSVVKETFDQMASLDQKADQVVFKNKDADRLKALESEPVASERQSPQLSGNISKGKAPDLLLMNTSAKAQLPLNKEMPENKQNRELKAVKTNGSSSNGDSENSPFGYYPNSEVEERRQPSIDGPLYHQNNAIQKSQILTNGGNIPIIHPSQLNILEQSESHLPKESLFKKGDLLEV